MGGLYEYFTTKLKIKGYEASCIVFETRHDKSLEQECVDLGYTVFDIRHPDNDWGAPRTIERNVLVNFFGYIALKDEKVIGLLNKKLEKDSFLQVNSRSLDCFGNNAIFYQNAELLTALT